MGIDRRNFFKALGATGVCLATGKKLSSAPDKTEDEIVEFKGMLYDSTKCRGCGGCSFDCADTHGLPMPEYDIEVGIHTKLDETKRTVVNAYQTSKGVAFLKQQCMHCNEPACATACLTQAMKKTKEGPVIWREDKCMGCRYCMISCPFDIPKFEYHSTNPKIIKCTMCFELQKEGEVPACAYNCPEEALLFGTRRELIKEARKRIHEEPDRYVDHIYGEHEAGGTAWLILSGVPFEELGLPTNIQTKSYPALTKGFVSSIAPVDVLLPAFLLGVYEATKSKNKNKKEDNHE